MGGEMNSNGGEEMREKFLNDRVVDERDFVKKLTGFLWFVI